MKVNKVPYSKLNFHAGMTERIVNQIQKCNVDNITKDFARRGIETDFDNNKMVAWCSLQVTKIIEALNKNYNLNLSLPPQIRMIKYTGDKKKDFVAACTVEDEYTENDNILIQSKSVLYNDSVNWYDINSYSDRRFKCGFASTDSFLNIFLHEFSHSFHLNKLYCDMGKEKFAKKIFPIADNGYKFSSSTWLMLDEKICNSATYSPLEAVADDLTRRIINTLDPKTLLPKSNPFENSPYEEISGLAKLKHIFTDDFYTRKMRSFWNGKF